MPIRTIEMICIPCDKCTELEKKVRLLVKNMESDFRIKIPFEFKHTTNLRDITKYSLNPSQTPILLINGNVELAGRADFITLKKKMEIAQKSA